MLRIKHKGQSVLEYTVLITILAGALLASSNYFKRAIQGRWKETVDGLGEQYDPRFANSSVLHSIESNTVTKVYVINVAGGTYTYRNDITNAIDTRKGSIVIESY